PDILMALESTVRAASASQKFKQELNRLGFEPIGSSADAFKTYIDEEIARSGKIVRDAGITAEELGHYTQPSSSGRGRRPPENYAADCGEKVRGCTERVATSNFPRAHRAFARIHGHC